MPVEYLNDKNYLVLNRGISYKIVIPEQATACDKCCVPVTSGDTRGWVPWVPASPYMSFAPYLTEEAVEKFPAIAHFDGTARQVKLSVI